MGKFSNELHVQELVYDVAVDGGSVGAYDLSAKASKSGMPVGSLVKAVYAKVVTAFTSGGAATLEWGPTADADGYSGAAKAVGALVDDAAFSGQEDSAALLSGGVYAVVGASGSDFKVTVGAAAMTAGKAVFMVEYYKPTLS